MKLIIIILLFCSALFFSCKPKIENHYFPSFEQFEQGYFDTIKLSKIKSYNDLLRKIEISQDNYHYLKLTDKNKVHNLLFTTRLGHCYPLYYKMKNMITISEKYVMKNEITFSKDSFPKILKRDLENEGKNIMLAESPEKLQIIFVLDDHKNFDSLGSYLLNIINEFNRLNHNRKHQLNIQINKDFYYYQNLFKELKKA